MKNGMFLVGAAFVLAVCSASGEGNGLGKGSEGRCHEAA